jgi:hypothetical protein
LHDIRNFKNLIASHVSRLASMRFSQFGERQ